MNYFFTITSNFLSCKLTVPKFQNRANLKLSKN